MQTLEGSTFTGVFAGIPEQIKTVRDQVRDFLDGCPVTDDVVLVVSELAANATLHSHSGNGTFTVRVERHDSHVHVEVTDAGGPWVPAPRDDRPHGLDIVSALAGQWGVKESPGRTVWARLDISEGKMLCGCAAGAVILVTCTASTSRCCCGAWAEPKPIPASATATRASMSRG